MYTCLTDSVGAQVCSFCGACGACGVCGVCGVCGACGACGAFMHVHLFNAFSD